MAGWQATRSHFELLCCCCCCGDFFFSIQTLVLCVTTQINQISIDCIKLSRKYSRHSVRHLSKRLGKAFRQSFIHSCIQQLTICLRNVFESINASELISGRLPFSLLFLLSRQVPSFLPIVYRLFAKICMRDWIMWTCRSALVWNEKSSECAFDWHYQRWSNYLVLRKKCRHFICCCCCSCFCINWFCNSI